MRNNPALTRIIRSMYYSKGKSHYRPRGRSSRGFGGLTALLLGVLIGALLFSSAERIGSAGGTAPYNNKDAASNGAQALPLAPVKASVEEERGAGSPSAADTGNAEPEAEDGESLPAETLRLPSRIVTVSVDGKAAPLDIEDYLVGVVAGEMPASSEKEALMAQAVAARTFTALHAVGKARCRSGCTVCSDPDCCQAYLSEEERRAAWGEKFEEYEEKIEAAVRDTEGLAAVYEGELINAFYHASSGPATESSEEVFAMALPYLVSVDSREGDREVVTRQEFSAEEAIRRINAAYPEANMRIPIGEHELEIWGRNASGRVQLIRIGDTVIPGGALRRTLGLKSAAFTVEYDDEKVVFTCLGFGHGVGMSQTGANEMAKKGADFKEILKHFYTGTGLAVLSYGD